MPAIDSIPLLLAADIWQVVVGLIFFVLYSLGQWANAREQAKKKPAKPRRPQAPQRKGLEGQEPKMPLAGQGNQEVALRREVEDFLQRAQGKPPRQKQPVRPLSKPRALPSKQAQPATNLREEGVAEHVASHLSSKQMVEHAEHLGKKVGLADERLALRLHEKFDHQLGSFKREEKPTASQEKELSAAEEVVDLLRKPGGMRQIIIAQEILRRPEW